MHPPQCLFPPHPTSTVVAETGRLLLIPGGTVPYFDKLASLRKQAGFTVSELARLAKVNRDTISKAEKHDSVRAEKLYMILNALNAHYYKKEGKPLDGTALITERSSFADSPAQAQGELQS